jgi:hypothetical protein
MTESIRLPPVWQWSTFMHRSIRNESRIPLIERAFQLPRTGAFAKISEISHRLKREGYTATEIAIYLEGGSIRKDLSRICREAV